MKSLFLFPYGLFPVDTGAKVEAWKVLDVLESLGECSVLSARTKPVGAGWSAKDKETMRDKNLTLLLREDLHKFKSLQQLAGIVYAGICKIAGLETAFGHSNPYHRYAFPLDCLSSLSKHYDLVVINYSYWARLPTTCPKVVILHDLMSENMAGGFKSETADLATADLVVVISYDEEQTLRARGIKNLLWSPPAVERLDYRLSNNIGMIGSDNRFNLEGLQWLSSCTSGFDISINVYGNISKYATNDIFEPIGRYQETMDPYKDCGVILVPTSQGTGVQIKIVEALAAGRAIVARRGALRGLPHSTNAWIEVDSPADMLSAAKILVKNVSEKERLGQAAHAYYEKHLNAGNIKRQLMSSINKVIK